MIITTLLLPLGHIPFKWNINQISGSRDLLVFEHEGNFADVLAFAITCMDAIEHREGKRWCTLMQPCGGA
jgi:hypothetical protein